jgi:hypothetical protein
MMIKALIDMVSAQSKHYKVLFNGIVPENITRDEAIILASCAAISGAISALETSGAFPEMKGLHFAMEKNTNQKTGEIDAERTYNDYLAMHELVEGRKG